MKEFTLSLKFIVCCRVNLPSKVDHNMRCEMQMWGSKSKFMWFQKRSFQLSLELETHKTNGNIKAVCFKSVLRLRKAMLAKLLLQYNGLSESDKVITRLSQCCYSVRSLFWTVSLRRQSTERWFHCSCIVFSFVKLYTISSKSCFMKLAR